MTNEQLNLIADIVVRARSASDAALAEAEIIPLLEGLDQLARMDERAELRTKVIGGMESYLRKVREYLAKDGYSLSALGASEALSALSRVLKLLDETET